MQKNLTKAEKNALKKIVSLPDKEFIEVSSVILNLSGILDNTKESKTFKRKHKKEIDEVRKSINIDQIIKESNALETK